MVKAGIGLRDWIVQRLSAIAIGVYALFIVIYLLCHDPLYFAQWQALYQHLLMRMATFIVILAILWHSWIGIWTVLTDYVKPALVRLSLQGFVILLLLAYGVWGFDILWGF